MLKNVSYNDDKTINEIDDFVGKPFSIFERLKIGGIGSSKLLITKTDTIINNLLELDNNINCFNSSKQDLEKKYVIIEKNLKRYSKDFLKKINLKYIVLCEDLSISGIGTAGIPDNVMKTLIVDIKFNEKYFERVLHHEVFHIINDSYREIFNEKIWSSFNPLGFNYAECSTCTKKIGLDTYLKTNGFITEYSRSTASEDMAEVFSHLMYGNLPEEIDPILKKKIEFIKKGISKIDKNFIL